MNHYKLIFEEFACWGCKACEVACKQEYDALPWETYDPTAADTTKFVSVWGDGPKGLEGKLDFMYRVNVCKHCTEPPCALACPEDAITRDAETGIVLHHKDKCNGCKAIPGQSGPEKQGSSPCKVDCPAHNNVQGYVNLAAKGKYRDALQLIKETSPFPSICGRVCYHPCESNCNRQQIDDPVAIHSVERFLGDLDLFGGATYVPNVRESRNTKVAVIGSGPAGLTAAYFLARDGYRVTVYEKLPVAGGMMAVGIPEYRLPRENLIREVRVIQEMGVEIRTGIDVGRDITIAELREQQTKAFFLAVGAQECKRLGVEGDDLEGVYPGVDFLRRVNLGETVYPGRRVAVIGGGNVAMDAARIALRTGAEEVCLLYRRSLHEMPASREEIEECEQEGIKIHVLTVPKRIVGEKGRVKAIECVRVELGEPDESGRRRPVPLRGSEFLMDVEAVIPAVGQESDWACLGPECACTLSPWGTMNVDPLTLQTDDPDLFAGGDAVTGPRTVVEAIAAGQRAAVSMDRYLKGLSLRDERNLSPLSITKPAMETYSPSPRAEMPCLSPRERVKSFAEVRLGFTEGVAIQEATRCLSCGTCCIQACPYEAIAFNEQSGKTEKCNLCYQRVTNGLYPACADNVCLAHCIYFGDPAEIEKQVVEKRKRRGGSGEIIPKAIAFLKPS
jgi:NADPH-dependent glutamate synthase beta subunit-like oxidoreductase